jgi:hypothetical protein
MDRMEMMLEADRRGLLPPEKKAMLDEAVKRGLVKAPVDHVAAGAQMAINDTPTMEKGLVSLGRGLTDVGQGAQQLYAMAADAVAPRKGQSRSDEINTRVQNELEQFKPFEEQVGGASIGRATGAALPTILIPAGKLAQGTGAVISKVAPAAGARVAQSVAADAALTGGALGGVMATGEGESHLGNAVAGTVAGAGTVGALNLAGKAASPVIRRVADAVNPTVVKDAGIAANGKLTADTVRSLEKEGIDVASLTAETRDRLAKLAAGAVQGNPVTPAELARAARLENLPVPISGTKGQLSKDFGQNQLEQSLSKNSSSGGPLRDKFSEQDAKLIENLDKFRANTGAKTANSGDTGRSIDAALQARIEKSNANISSLYREAEKKGETMQKIDLDPLIQQLNKNPGTNPFAESQLKAMKLVKEVDGNLMPTHTITLNDLELVRRRASKVSGTATDGTVRHDAGQLVKQIDAMIGDDVGGKAYQAARAARREHALAFEEPGVVQNVVGMKSRTDRSVPFEGVFKKTVINGSVDDLKLLKQTLLHNDPATREAGVQALKNMRGEAMQYLKDAATNNAHGDTSEAALRRAYNQIGKDKMSELFGGNVSKQFANFLEAVKDLKVAPKGSYNPSGTAGELVNWVERILSPLTMTGRLGRAAVSGASKLAEGIQAGGKVSEAVNPMGGIAAANKAATVAQQNERIKALLEGPVSRRIKGGAAAVGAAAASQ